MKVRDFITMGLISGRKEVAKASKFATKNEADIDAITETDYIVSFKNDREYELWYISSMFAKSKKIASSIKQGWIEMLKDKIVHDIVDPTLITATNLDTRLKDIAEELFSQLDNGSYKSL